MQIGNLNIRYNNLSYWPKSLRLGATFSVACLLLLSLYFIDIQSQLTRLKKATYKEIELKKKFAHEQQQTMQLPAYKKQLAILNTKKKIIPKATTKTGGFIDCDCNNRHTRTDS